MKIFQQTDTHRWICSLCRGKTSSDVLAFESVPYILGVTDLPQDRDRTVSFQLGQCERCQLVQHNHPISGDMYSEIHSHAVGKVWDEHRRSFTDYINRTTKFPLARVLEIGPSANPMARELRTGALGNVTYVDFMAEPPFELSSNETYHAGYFPHAELIGKKFDTIIASHVLEHAPDLQTFFGNLVDSLADDGAIYLSIPDFDRWINDKYWNAFSLEHVVYPVESQLSEMVAATDMDYEVYYYEGHSVFITLRSLPTRRQVPPSTLWHDGVIPWHKHINEQISAFELAIQETAEPVYLSGASHLSQYVLNMSSLLRRRCVGVFDNAQSKHGKRLYGTATQVISFDALRNLHQATVIVPSSPYQKEICTQIASLSGNARIVAP